MSEVTVNDYVTDHVKPLSISQVFEWPPDLFAATSAVLRITGAYRHLVSPPDGQQWPPVLPQRWADETWTRATEMVAVEWLTAIADAASFNLPDWVAYLKAELEATWTKTTIEDLRNIENNPEAWRLCEALLTLHGIADSACSGFGTPAAPRRNPFIYFLADHLLSTYGSLSRLPRAKGIVLPKMRTPQSGLTLRATSLYATWHETEVEAVWRSTPWVNAEENTLNVLILPWPAEVHPGCFERNQIPAGRRNLGPDRYFSYAPKQPFDADRVVALIKASEPLASRVHLLVLPELAISHAELRELQLKLADQLQPDRIPLIISGVRSWMPSAADAARAESEPGCNSVVLSMYFADKWYDIRQDKHHRWKLDRRQVQQYTIGGVLASDRNWWENLPIPPRKLSILAPTGWLALCPLICEDLAQLEPVSELIRGVGPTLLVALLLDGPQLPSRWSARYASVMADDPGSSVLTVTSLGMASRSKPPLGTPVPAGPGQEPDGVTIALWRDAASGFRELRLKPGDDALIVTLAANWREEMTADGRGDGGSAATFILNGVQAVRAPAAVSPSVASVRKGVMKGDQEDLYELTTFTQLVDSALDAPRDVVTDIISVARGEPAGTSTAFPPEVQAVVDLIQLAEPRWRPNRLKEREFTAALTYFESLVTRFADPILNPSPTRLRWNNATVALHIQRWEQVVGVVERETVDLRTSDEKVRRRRTKLAVLHNVLWAVHNRLEHMRRSGELTMHGTSIEKKIELALRTKWTFDPHDEHAVGQQAGA